MSDSSKTDGRRPLGTRVRDWFNGGDPDGPAKIRTWATGDDDRWHDYTHSMGKYVTWLMVIACILYPFTRGIGSILALVVAIFLMGGRALIERQVRRDVSDLEEAKKQYGLTRNPEYLQFMTLRATRSLPPPPARSWRATPSGPASARSVRPRSRPRRPARRRRRPAARPTPAGARYRWMTSPRPRPQRSGRIGLLTAPEQLLGGSQAALRRLRTGGT